MIRLHKCLVLLISLFLFASLSAQSKIRTYERLNPDSVEILRETYGKHKTYPKEFEEQFLIALSHYPQLRDVKVNLLFDKEKTTMSARPDIGSLFCRKRVYSIRINDSESFDGILLKDIPFNAQIGVIGHELAHLVDYEQKNFFRIIGTGIGYLNPRYKRKLEHKIDGVTIQHGLGWQLYDWARYSMDETYSTPKYVRFKKKIYMGPDKILTLMGSPVNL